MKLIFLLCLLLSFSLVAMKENNLKEVAQIYSKDFDDEDPLPKAINKLFQEFTEVVGCEVEMIMVVDLSKVNDVSQLNKFTYDSW